MILGCSPPSVASSTAVVSGSIAGTVEGATAFEAVLLCGGVFSISRSPLEL